MFCSKHCTHNASCHLSFLVGMAETCSLWSHCGYCLDCEDYCCGHSYYSHQHLGTVTSHTSVVTTAVMVSMVSVDGDSDVSLNLNHLKVHHSVS